MGFEEIKNGIYFIGASVNRKGLDCNPYLIIDNEEAVLFDPGSTLDFEIVLENLEALIDLNMIKYIVVHHQDPDVCASVPLYEKMGLKFKVVTSWRSMTLTQYYGIESDFYILEENGYSLTLESGRELSFLQTPYLHFPGAFVTYDAQSRILFSSDLFGAFSFNWTVYADEEYMGKMLTFHEHYMPSNTVLRPVMEMLLTYDIEIIMPQHGSIINKDVKKYINALRTLECGSLLSPVKKSLKEAGGYVHLYNDVLKRLLTLYPHEEVLSVFSNVEGMEIEENEILKYSGSPDAAWNSIFDEIREEKGMTWIMVIEPLVRTLCATYDVEMPQAMDSLLHSVQLENEKLIEANKSLQSTINTVNEKLIKCEITGLYNESFFKSLMLEELSNEDWRDVGAVAVIELDDFSKYKLKYGAEEEKNLLNNVAYLLKEAFGESAVFKMDATDFALYIKSMEKNAIIDKIEKIRVDISKSSLILGNITVTVGLAFNDELNLDDTSLDLTVQSYIDLGLSRLNVAKQKGKNCLCYCGENLEGAESSAYVLIADYDETNLGVLSTFIKDIGVEVIQAKDGVEAYHLAHEKLPFMIVSEINLPKMDGFVLRERLNSDSRTKDIEFMYLSYMKDETTVNRAVELGVYHYLQKPYLLSELIGIIKRSVKGRM